MVWRRSFDKESVPLAIEFYLPHKKTRICLYRDYQEIVLVENLLGIYMYPHPTFSLYETPAWEMVQR